MIKLWKYVEDDVKVIKVAASAAVLVMMMGWNLHARDCVDPYDTDCGYAPFPNDYIVVQPDEWQKPNSHGSREDENWKWNINGEHGDHALRDEVRDD